MSYWSINSSHYYESSSIPCVLSRNAENDSMDFHFLPGHLSQDKIRHFRFRTDVKVDYPCEFGSATIITLNGPRKSCENLIATCTILPTQIFVNCLSMQMLDLSTLYCLLLTFRDTFILFFFKRKVIYILDSLTILLMELLLLKYLNWPIFECFEENFPVIAHLKWHTSSIFVYCHFWRNRAGWTL